MASEILQVVDCEFTNKSLKVELQTQLISWDVNFERGPIKQKLAQQCSSPTTREAEHVMDPCPVKTLWPPREMQSFCPCCPTT